MTNELPDTRASDAERERVAEVLREAVAEGRLEMEEFQERLDLAYRARTRGELRPLLSDLPAGTDTAQTGELAGTSGSAAPSTRGGTGRWADRIGGVATARRAIALLGGFARRGAWTVPARFRAFAFWGGGQIDLRDARFAEREVVIHCVAIMGGIHVVAPLGAEVEVRGFGVMGGFDPGATGDGEPGAPRVVVTGFALWGGVGTERKPSRAERHRAREQREVTGSAPRSLERHPDERQRHPDEEGPGGER